MALNERLGARGGCKDSRFQKKKKRKSKISRFRRETKADFHENFLMFLKNSNLKL